jgi:hypothetical protein
MVLDIGMDAERREAGERACPARSGLERDRSDEDVPDDTAGVLRHE